MKLKRLVAAMAAGIMAFSSMAVNASAYNQLGCNNTVSVSSSFSEYVICDIEQTRWASWGQYTVTLCEVSGKGEYIAGNLGVYVAMKKNDSWGLWAYASAKPNGQSTVFTDDVTITGDKKWSPGVGIGYNGNNTVFRGFLFY